mgnify:CR=1 FL=1
MDFKTVHVDIYMTHVEKKKYAIQQLIRLDYDCIALVWVLCDAMVDNPSTIHIIR